MFKSTLTLTTHTHTHTHTHTNTHSHNSHTHKHTHTLTLTTLILHIHTHTHTHTHTQTHICDTQAHSTLHNYSKYPPSLRVKSHQPLCTCTHVATHTFSYTYHTQILLSTHTHTHTHRDKHPQSVFFPYYCWHFIVISKPVSHTFISFMDLSKNVKTCFLALIITHTHTQTDRGKERDKGRTWDRYSNTEEWRKGRERKKESKKS